MLKSLKIHPLSNLENWMYEKMLSELDLSQVQQMADLHALCFKEPWDSSFFQSRLKSPHAQAFGIFTDTQVLIAMLLGDCVEGDFEVLTLCTHPSYLKQGYARQLLLHIMSTKEVTKVFLDVDVGNRPACALYHKCGFTPYGVRRDYYAVANKKQDSQNTQKELAGEAFLPFWPEENLMEGARERSGKGEGYQSGDALLLVYHKK